MKTKNQMRAEIIKEICGIAKNIRPEEEIKDAIAVSRFNYEYKIERLAARIGALAEMLEKLNSENEKRN